jgi:tetratricopeptide (TPR) repeat protein
MGDAIRTSEDDFLEAIEHMNAGEYDLALPILARLVAFEPDDNEIFERWIDAHIGLGRYQRAIEIADAGIAQGRPSEALEIWKALAYKKLGDLERAEAAARASWAADPSFSAPVIFLSTLLREQERYDEALEICRRAAEQNPEDEDLAFEAVEAADGTERADLVIDLARSFLKRFGKRDDVLSLLGGAYADRKEYRKAERAFRDAAALEPDVVMTMYTGGDERGGDAYLDKLAERDEELADRVGDAVDEFFDLMAKEEEPPQD